MDAYTFTTDLSLEEIEARLSGLENFDVKDKTEDRITVNVGSVLKYRFLGVYLTQDYQAPMQIEVTDNGDGTTTVELSDRGNKAAAFVTGKADRFYEESFEQLRSSLSA